MGKFLKKYDLSLDFKFNLCYNINTIWIGSPEAGGKGLKILTGWVRIPLDPPN